MRTGRSPRPRTLLVMAIASVQNQNGSRTLTVDISGTWTVYSLGDSIPNGSPVSFQRQSDAVLFANKTTWVVDSQSKSKYTSREPGAGT
jgi:hypothetical protein